LSKFQYRPAIDGMRAIAVLDVLVFHLDKSLLPGGFVGVDVFFVISGYLITSIIYDATRVDGFSLLSFYQRRIARIFPVFFCVTSAILAAAAIWYSSQDLASAGALASASALSVANFKMMFQGNYFEMLPDSQPFMHYWSLSVEEQFYMILPMIFVATQRFKLSRRLLLGLLWGLALTSFFACLIVTYRRPIWAFYLLPTRAWELLSGSILAVISQSPTSTPERGRGWLAVIGLLLMVMSPVLITESLPFPGWVAVLPVAGSILVIGRSHDSQNLTERLLSHRWMVGVGKASYSLYLWHWPVYCFIDYRLFAVATPPRVAAKIALTVALSVASYFVIERPCRTYLADRRNRKLGFIGFALCVFMFAVGGVAIRSDQYIDASPHSVAGGGLAFEAAPAAPTVVLMGDSNGSMYGKSMKALSASDSLNVNVISVSAGDPLPGSRLYEDSIAFLKAKRPDVTVFAAAWTPELAQGMDKFAVALNQILQYSSFVVVIGQPPILPKYATRQMFRSQGVGPVFEDAQSAEQRRRTNAALTAFESDRVKVILIDSLFEMADGEVMYCDALGRQLYHDRTHLSGVGADRVVKPLSETIHGLLERKAREPDSTTR
jgi:peptidoglycan/LPS O-acetylase OafA/YrhL